MSWEPRKAVLHPASPGYRAHAQKAVCFLLRVLPDLSCIFRSGQGCGQSEGALELGLGVPCWARY